MPKTHILQPEDRYLLPLYIKPRDTHESFRDIFRLCDIDYVDAIISYLRQNRIETYLSGGAINHY